jgi:acetoin utilization deacetylase AcuC-like enzyme
MTSTRTLHIAFDPIYAHPLPEGHRFPMLKYELIPEQLIYEGAIQRHHLFAPKPCAHEDVLRCHDEAYYNRLLQQQLSSKEQRAIGFPQSPALTLRERIIAQGTIDCCYHAKKNGIALNVAGGTHHAFRDKGEGFCLLNDFAIAAKTLLHRGDASKIVIIDLDVHQGNGTASIFEHEPRVFTMSMHGAHNYPFHKENSDLDIPLPEGMDDLKPDHVFYLSGVDILSTDKFGKLAISMEGCKERDRIVFDHLLKHQVPCTVAMGGGYSPDIKTITEAHCNTFRLAKEMYELQ